MFQREKLRVVIDGSAEPRVGSSANVCLSPGPSIHLDLPSVLHRFHRFKLALSTDIAKAYLMVSVDPSDRPYLKILLPDGDIRQFEATVRPGLLRFAPAPRGATPLFTG